MKNIVLLTIIASLFVSSVAQADNAPPVSYGANVGAIEVLNLPDEAHLGLYPYVAGSVIVPVGSTSLIASLGVEWSPEFDRWGFFGSFMVDIPITSWIGIDSMVAFIHDQPGSRWGESLYLVGLGPGATIYLNKWTISPSFVTFRCLNVEVWSYVPGLNIGYTF